MADILDDLRSHSKICRMTGNEGCLTDKLAARAVTEIERLRRAVADEIEDARLQSLVDRERCD